MRKQNPDRKKYLKASKKYLRNIIACIEDIENGIPETRACEKHNIHTSAFRRLLFNKPLGFTPYQPDMKHPEPYVSAPEEMIYKDITLRSEILTYPSDLNETIPFVMKQFLTEREQTILRHRYYDNETFTEIGRRLNTSKEYAQQTTENALKKLRRIESMNIIEYGMQYYYDMRRLRELKTLKFRENYLKEFQRNYKLAKDNIEMQINGDIVKLIKETDDSVQKEIEKIDRKAMPITKLDITPRTKNCLHRANINLIGELCNLTYQDLTRIKTMGDVSINDIIIALEKIGLELSAKQKRRRRK